MSDKKILSISKKPSLITTTPSDTSYKNISQSELLKKVKTLHEQLLKTNQYLMDVHRMSIYNWDSSDTGNIMVTLPETSKGFLLDSVLRLRGSWNPEENNPNLLPNDTSKTGWVYKVNCTHPTEKFSSVWKDGDYALYDEEGNLYNVQNDMLENLFTPIVTIESDSIQFDPLPQSSSEGIQLRAHVKVDPTNGNDINVSSKGLFSDAYQRAKELITVTTEAPTEDNTEGGFHIVYLQEPPSTFYGGYLYLIPPASMNLQE